MVRDFTYVDDIIDEPFGTDVDVMEEDTSEGDADGEAGPGPKGVGSDPLDGRAWNRS